VEPRNMNDACRLRTSLVHFVRSRNRARGGQRGHGTTLRRCYWAVLIGAWMIPVIAAARGVLVCETYNDEKLRIRSRRSSY
jgi:hypothetical protein